MRNLILGLHMSLDGCIAGPNNELDWTVWDQEVDDWTLQELDRCDTAVLGREMYQQFFSYWPAKTAPFFSKGEEKFARWINEVPKVVFSTSLPTVEWNATLARGDVAEEIARLKQQPGKDMLVVGGVRFPQALARLGLIDEYRLLVNPVVLGDGKRLFGDRKDRANLKLLDAKPFAAGAVFLTYAKKDG